MKGIVQLNSPITSASLWFVFIDFFFLVLPAVPLLLLLLLVVLPSVFPLDSMIACGVAKCCLFLLLLSNARAICAARDEPSADISCCAMDSKCALVNPVGADEAD